ncbi:hypothetical protein EDC04DRAFT_2604521 [Pisolithus marmoratus]|nr:hypothetical protein EDC04DRAFT_2604521 [Pisolithus marmoratus]
MSCVWLLHASILPLLVYNLLIQQHHFEAKSFFESFVHWSSGFGALQVLDRLGACQELPCPTHQSSCVSLKSSFERSWGAFDAHVLTKFNDHWITSPNVDYVPQPFIFEEARVEPLCDGQFGHIDCFQWLQLHAECYVWSLVEDFILEGGSAFKDWMKKYPHYDGPLRDTVILVAFCQCLCLDIFIMLEYLQMALIPTEGAFIDAFNHWMGAFTMDPKECQLLFEARVPIWLVWKPNHVPADMKVLKEGEVTYPVDIIMDPEDFDVGQVLKWKGGWCYPGQSCHFTLRRAL